MGKFHCLQVVLFCAVLNNLSVCSTYRLGKSKVSNSESSIFKNGREPSSTFHADKKPAYALQNAINTANLVSLPAPISNALVVLFPEQNSSATVETSSANAPPTSSSANDPPVGPNEILPGGGNSIPASFPSLVELIALQPDPGATRPTVTYYPIFENTTTPIEQTETTESSTTESTSPEPTTTTTISTTSETMSSSTDSPSPSPDPTSTTQDPSASTDSSSLAATESTSPAVSDPTSTTQDSSASTDSSSLAATESTSPAVSDPTSTTQDSSASTDSSSLAATESTSPAVSDPTSTTLEPSSSTDSSSLAATESTTPAVSDPTSTTQDPSASTDSSSVAATESTSPAVSDPTSTTLEPSSSTDSSSVAATESTSPAVSDPTSTTQDPSASTDSSSVAATESTSPAVSDPTSTTLEPSSSTDSSSVAATESTSPAVSDPTSTTQDPSASTDSSSLAATESTSPAVSDPTSTTLEPSSSTDSSSVAATESTSPAVSDPTSTTQDPSASTDSSSLAATESTSPAVSDPTTTTLESSSSTDSSSTAATESTTVFTSPVTEPTSPAVTDPTSTTQDPSSSTDSSSSAATESTSSAATESTSPAVSDPTSTTQDTSSSTDSSSSAATESTTSPASESTSPAVSDPTSTTQDPSSSTDSSSPAATESTSSAATESTSPAVSDPTSTTQDPSSSTDSSSPAATESTSSAATESTSPAVSDPTSTTQDPSSSTDSSSSAATESTSTSSPPTDSTPNSSTDPTPSSTPATALLVAPPAVIPSQQPNIYQFFPGFSVPSSGSGTLLPSIGGNPPETANDSPLDQIQGAASQLLASSNIPSIFNSTAGGLNAIASLPNGINIPSFPSLSDTFVANDSPIEQIQTTASQLLASGNIPNVFNATTSGLNAISSIPSNAGINIPQLPILGDTPVANDNPLNQLQTTATQLLASSNIPSVFNSTAAEISSIASNAGIPIPQVPTLGDAPVASDTPYQPANDSPIAQIQGIASEAVNAVNSTVNNNNPINQAQNAASQLLASSNIPSIFNATSSGLNSFALPSFNIPQIPTLSDTPVSNNRPINLPSYKPPSDLSNFQSQLAALASQLKNETAPFPNNPSVQSDDILTKPQTNPVSSAQLQPNQPVTEKHPLLTIFPQQVLSDSYFGIPSFNLPNSTFGQFINQLAGLASNFTGGASNATGANSTESNNSETNPLQSIGNQITAGFGNVAEIISNGTAAIGNLGAQIANQTTSSNGTSTNNADGTAIPDANQLGGTISQFISNGTSFIAAPINSIFSTNFSRAYNPALTNLYNQLSSVGGNETTTQVINALSPAVLAGQLSGLVSQLQASNPLASNDAGQKQETGANGILNWNAINKIPIVSNWIGTNSNNKPIAIAKPTLSCPVCQEVCGKVNSPVKLRQQRVVGGTAVDPANKYPWTTRFVYFNTNAGQGSLINDRAVVTTATTVLGMPLFSQATALFNVYDTMSTTEQRFSKNLARVIPHPKFNANNPFNNNIGIVILDSPVAMSEFIQPICLPTSFDSYAGTEAVVAGWGADSAGGHPSPIPHEVSIPLYSPAECKLANGELTNNNLCGGVVEPAQPGSVKSTCEGDDGAGLMAPSRVDSSVLTLIGITIETPEGGCGSNNQPAVFTNVQNYIDFILYNGIGCGC